MRTLTFLVDHTTLTHDPSKPVEGLFPAPNQEIQAHFVFSEDWSSNGVTATSIPKVAAFYSMLGTEFPPQIIDEENHCMIPPEALSLPAFKIQVLGSVQGKLITTNTLTVYQKGGKA